ncbi:MAG: hypothetical protein IKN53_05270, partial [Oscillibacter sp.]|nr:hypothetical protein [Oscillibacter sp.]
YSEGIFDDLNKVVCAELAWDETLSLRASVEDYIGYEYPGVDAEKCFELIMLIDHNHNLTNKFVLKHPDMEKAERASALADELDAQIYAPYKTSWRWRILYIRAKLDLIRFTSCEAAGWPVEDYPKSYRNYGNYFWGRYLNDTAESRGYLRELCGIYHASTVDDPERFVCHNRLRPPLIEP